MKKAIGMVEYKTVSSGMLAADRMVKTAEVDVLEATTVCPGKYMVIKYRLVNNNTNITTSAYFASSLASGVPSCMSDLRHLCNI